MIVRFWGTRGSIATPGSTTLRHGGNTSCVEVRSTTGTLAILDCGTGAHGLGQSLAAKTAGTRGYLLITHTHWDHIQGLPFFRPLFIAGNEWDIYAPRRLGESLRTTLARQMQYTYFPVALEQLGATIRYHDLVEGVFDIGDIRVTGQYLNHPTLTLGYRLEADGATVVYATDHEPHSRKLALANGGEIEREDRRHAEFLADADLVIHDAQYEAQEYPDKEGWGHSTVESVVDVACSAGVRRLALFHHDPQRDDDAIDRLVELARRRVASAGSSMEVFAAAEGQTIELEREVPVGAGTASGERSAAAESPPTLLSQSVLVAVSDPTVAATLSEAVSADGIPLLVADDDESALRMVESERPSLLLLEHRLPGRDGLEVCRAVRRGMGSYGEDVAIILVADKQSGPDADADSDGVTDWLLHPFSETYARTRVRAWLLRIACRWSPAPYPRNEEDRLRALKSLNILDTEPEPRFDRLTRLAAATFDVPIALVSLIDAERQWFKSCYGIGVSEGSRETAFCAHAILGEDVMVVPDALLDPRFADNPAVTGPPHVRFYAGCPLSLADGSRVGTLCLVDHRPRRLDEAELGLLRDLAFLVVRELTATRED